VRRRPLLWPLVAVAAALAPAVGAGQTVVNADFEAATLAGDLLRPTGWSIERAGYEITVDTTERVHGRASLRSRRVDTSVLAMTGAHRDDLVDRASYVASQITLPERARGRGVRLTGWIRTEDVLPGGYAGLWVEAYRGQVRLVRGDMSDRAPRGNAPWARYVVEIPVDSDATTIAFGTAHAGAGTAWFDSLTLDVIDPPPPSWVVTAAYAPPPHPREDHTRLLRDAELAVPNDSVPPAVDSAAAAWVRANARPVRSLGATEFSDLAFLAPLLAGKRVVQLGESGHGVREFDLAKVRLIRFLHERLGYDVLAFESSLFGCERAGREAARLTPRELMRRCFGGVWGTAEVLPLAAYIRETQRTPHPLRLTGVDVQPNFLADSARPAFLRRVVAAADRGYARQVYETDAAFLRAGAGGLAALPAPESARYAAFYDSLAAWLRARQRRIAARLPRPAEAVLARQVAVSMAQYARQRRWSVAEAREQMRIRDRGMADNVDFLLDEWYPGQKLIVWAHNGHVAYRGYAPGVTPAARTDGLPRMMGGYVGERRRTEVYTIGLYMYRGSAADNGGAAFPIWPAPPGSLEAILHRAPWRYAFVDVAHAPPGPGTAWMTQLLDAREEGRITAPVVPREDYDGVLFIDTTWPPHYLRDD
jgi:erythromycin esterase